MSSKVNFNFPLRFYLRYRPPTASTKMKIRTFLHLRNKQNLFILSGMSDIVTCSPNIYIWSIKSFSTS